MNFFAATVLVSVVLIGGAASSGGVVPPRMSPPASLDPGVVNERLAQMEVTLTEREPYRFELAYHGPTMPFRGLICYYFAGYNETCLDPKLTWLTPATLIELYAPGGVPRDLLEGYMMLVRYPALSERTFRYAAPGDPGSSSPQPAEAAGDLEH